MSDIFDNCAHPVFGRKLAVTPQGLNQTLFAELLSVIIAGFGDAIGIKRKRISGKELAFTYYAIPYREETQHSAGRMESFD